MPIQQALSRAFTHIVSLGSGGTETTLSSSGSTGSGEAGGSSDTTGTLQQTARRVTQRQAGAYGMEDNRLMTKPGVDVSVCVCLILTTDPLAPGEPSLPGLPCWGKSGVNTKHKYCPNLL